MSSAARQAIIIYLSTCLGKKFNHSVVSRSVLLEAIDANHTGVV